MDTQSTEYLIRKNQYELNNIALSYLRESNFLLAEKTLLKGLDLNPNNFAINYNLGCLYGFSDLEKSLIHYRAAYEIAPSHCFAKRNYLATLAKLARQAEKNENYKLVHQCLDELLMSEDDVDYARVEKSRIYSKQGDKENAKIWAELAVQENHYLADLVRGPDTF
jgi:tetratricopeptide (TPR) repeat protein